MIYYHENDRIDGPAKKYISYEETLKNSLQIGGSYILLPILKNLLSRGKMDSAYKEWIDRVFKHKIKDR